MRGFTWMWHTVLFQHHWQSTGVYSEQLVGSIFIATERVECACGARKWDITYDATRDKIARGGR